MIPAAIHISMIKAGYPTCAALARSLGIHRTSVRRILIGTRNSPKYLPKINRLLCFDVRPHIPKQEEK